MPKVFKKQTITPNYPNIVKAHHLPSPATHSRKPPGNPQGRGYPVGRGAGWGGVDGLVGIAYRGRKHGGTSDGHQQNRIVSESWTCVRHNRFHTDG